MKHKCECGSRCFIDHPISVTCDYGGIIGPRNFKLLECVRCSRKYTVSTESGRKELLVATGGAAMERDLMQLAVDGCYFERAGGTGTSNAILTDERDQLDIRRLDLKVDEKIFEKEEAEK